MLRFKLDKKRNQFCIEEAASYLIERAADGDLVDIPDLEILDEILKQLKKINEPDEPEFLYNGEIFFDVGKEKEMNIDLMYRMRYINGFEVRP